MKKSIKKLIACLLTVAMTASLVLSASAVSFSIPTQPMSTDDGVIKATAARAGQIAPLILGCNLVGSSNLGASSDDYNKISSILGVFGSDINASPDPYLYNYNYNLYAADNGLELVENAAIAEEQADGTPATTEAALNILTHRPDLILNQAAGTGNPAANEVYADVIATLDENTDDDPSNDYAPSYYTCSISTLVYQCDNLINLAQVINQICEEKGLTTRYGDPYVIATDYDKFVWGYYFYVQKQLAEGGIAKKTAAVISQTSDNGANWTLPALGTDVSQSKPNRLVEYVRDNTDTLNTTEETTAALADILACDVVVANGLGDTLRDAAAAAGYSESDLPLIIDTLPTCLYGMTMQTHENALGIPYIQSIIYASELDLNPVYAAAYFYQNFFHVTDNAALQETVSTLLGSATLPDGITTSLNQYDPQNVEAIIIEGIQYALQNGLTRHDDTEAWNPDMTVGIGSDASSTDEGDSDTLPFEDLTADWYMDAIQFVYENGLFGGTSDTTFEPDATMTRATAVTVLYRMAGSPAVTSAATFTDLTQDWYKDAAAWAQANGIAEGDGNGLFSPDTAITREQFVKMLAAYAQTVDSADVTVGGDLSAFSDAGDVSSWAADAVSWAVGSGILSGSDGALNPTGPVSRAQAAVILMNYAA